MNARPQAVQHVHALLVVLRVRIQVAVVAGGRAHRDKASGDGFLNPGHGTVAVAGVTWQESLSPVADFLDLLSNLVSPEGDEKHHALADLALKRRKIFHLSFSTLNSNLARMGIGSNSD